jgi:hypothetical protein
LRLSQQALLREELVAIAPESTLITYTDGLVERRRESLDAGMERLRKAASVKAQSVDGLLTDIADHIFGEKGRTTILRFWRFDGSADRVRPAMITGSVTMVHLSRVAGVLLASRNDRLRPDE